MFAKKLVLLTALTLFAAASAEAASVRVLTCKGTSVTEGYRKFRVNVLKDKKTGKVRATLSEGYTTQNTSETWNAKLKNGAGAISVKSVKNKKNTSLSLAVDLTQRAEVDGLEGFESLANIVHVATPYMGKPKTYVIDGKMACKQGK